MPGIVFLKPREKHAVLATQTEGTPVEITSKVGCHLCHLTFALAEKPVVVLGKPYHEDCNKKRLKQTARREALKEFLIEHAEDIGLRVFPHRSGRR